MTRDDWLAAAEECLNIAQECQQAGDRDRAAFWRRNAAALRDAATKSEQEPQNEQPQPVHQN